jgi:hypothetical protein
MRYRAVIVPIFAIILIAGLPRAASAEFFLTPYLGTTFNSSFDDYDEFGNKLHYGVGFTWLGQSGLGFEVDLGYAPTFFKEGDDELFDLESEGNLTTLMANLVIGRSGGGLQPYVSGGFGLIRSDIQGPLDLFEYSDNGFGVNVGAGIYAGSSRFGLRGDLRYFRQLSDLAPIGDLELGDFSFWRASAGLAIGF